MREKLAGLMHEIWAGWASSMLGRCEKGRAKILIIPRRWAQRWDRQIFTSYDELSEEEKDSDREQADKVLALMEPTYEAVRSNGKWNMVLRALVALYELHSQPCETDTYMAVEELMGAYDKWLD